MTKVKKMIYLAELFLCFAIPTLLLLFSIFLMLLSVGMIFEGKFEVMVLTWILIVSLGVSGFYGVYNVYRLMFTANAKVKNINLIRACLVCGLFGIFFAIYIFLLNKSYFIVIALLLPIFATVHYLIFLQRSTAVES
jgi:hypothetical protein